MPGGSGIPPVWSASFPSGLCTGSPNLHQVNISEADQGRDTVLQVADDESMVEPEFGQLWDTKSMVV